MRNRITAHLRWFWLLIVAVSCTATATLSGWIAVQTGNGKFWPTFWIFFAGTALWILAWYDYKVRRIDGRP